LGLGLEMLGSVFWISGMGFGVQAGCSSELV